jgi:hypothetical protein
VRYAAMLDLSATEAGDLIAEARRHVDPMDSDAMSRQTALTRDGAAGRWPLWVKLSVLGAILALVDTMWGHWLL